MIKTGALDSIIKEVIYEANIYNANIPEITETYTERNKIVKPLLQKLLEINLERKTRSDPALREDEEQSPQLRETKLAIIYLYKPNCLVSTDRKIK